MPRFPSVAPTIARLGGSAFSGLARKLRQRQGEVYPFHVGDTWLEPATGARMEDLHVEDHPGLHRYSPVRGHPDLVQALADRFAARQSVPTVRSNILVSAGATGGLAAAVGAVVEPGEEVLLAAPYWPLISGIVQSFRAAPVAVPIFGFVESIDGAIEAFEQQLTDRTVALYLNTPNNPTGRILPPDWLEALCAWAESRGLWILADEVYEDLCYTAPHTYARSLAPDRTFSVHSFSKGFGMSGNRCGCVVGPGRAIDEVRKVSTHTFYAAPTASQVAALQVLSEAGDCWLESARAAYQTAGRLTADRLGVPRPEGGTFLFLDVAEQLDGSGLTGLLGRCAKRGLMLAPGPSFGPFDTHIRLCFTAAPPDVTSRGVDLLARLLGR